ncbi:citrate transporter [Candidatus Woesearchaeota archaeon]|nr:citrate transporter [Candidatus Woesearchaeota archaeon]
MTIGIFFLAYLLIIFYYEQKAKIAFAAVALLVLLKVIGFSELFTAVNWNVIGIYVGMLFIAEMFTYSKMPEFLARTFVNRSKRTWIALIFVCALSGFISIFIENVATVLIVAPIALEIAREQKISPVKLIFGITVMSNLQGVATMIGDPPSLLLAAHASLKFNDFFFYLGKPSLFFAVQLGAAAGTLFLYYVFRKFRQKPAKVRHQHVISYIPAMILVLMVLLLALSSNFNGNYSGTILKHFLPYSAGLITLLLGLALLPWYHSHNKKDFKPMLKRLDWESGLFLIAIFILVASLKNVSFIEILGAFMTDVIGTNILFGFILIVTVSVLISGFVDNVPFIAAMLPVTQIIAQNSGINPFLLYAGLLIGVSVGGNITPIGASANIVGVGLLEKHGYKTTFWDFVKIGLPFTVITVVASSVFVWIVFA